MKLTVGRIVSVVLWAQMFACGSARPSSAGAVASPVATQQTESEPEIASLTEMPSLAVGAPPNEQVDDAWRIAVTPFDANQLQCDCTRCFSQWDDQHWSYAAALPPVALPSRVCGEPAFAAGYLVGAGAQITTLRREPEHDVLERRDAADGRLLRSLRYAPDEVRAAIGSDRIRVARVNGRLDAWPSGRGLTAFAGIVPPKDELPEATFGRVWGSAHWLLWNARTPEFNHWEAVRVDGSGRRVVKNALGEELVLGGCGEPLMGDHVLVLDGGAVVALPLTQDGQSWYVRRSPLTSAYCVAGEADHIVVTGLLNGLPAIAVHERQARASEDAERNGFWQVLSLAWSRGVLEPRFTGGQLLVSAPGETVSLPAAPDQAFEAAGALYVLSKQAEQWQVQERIIAAQPRRFGLFGFLAQATASELYINQLLAAEGEPMGLPSVCRVALTCAQSEPSCGYITAHASAGGPTVAHPAPARSASGVSPNVQYPKPRVPCTR